MLNRKQSFAYAAVLFQTLCLSAQARDVYVAADGQATGDGTKAHPLDFNSALNDGSVKPGDTVWLAAGDYKGAFAQSGKVAGTATSPIKFRATPGARVAIFGTLTVQSNYTWFQDLEITADTLDTPRGDAVGIRGGDGLKLINLIIHDTNYNGIGAWDVANDQEIYGCLSFNNGEKIHAQSHGIYTQNTAKHTVKTIRDCMFFNNNGYGVHCYGQDPELTGFVFDGVVTYGNGMAPGLTVPVINFLVGGYKKADNMTIRNSCTYFPAAGSYKRGADFGYSSGENGTITVENNMFIGGLEALWLKNWQNITFKGNACYTSRKQSLIVMPPSNFNAANSTIDNNTYFTGAGAALRYGGQNFNDLAAWTTATGWDKNSKLSPGAPRETVLRFRPNQYDPKRASLVVYNWPKTATTPVDLGKLWKFKKGEKYAIRSVEGLWDKPVAEGVYDGKPLGLPMAGKFAPEFAVYQVTRQ